jgi:hypothetical protein
MSTTLVTHQLSVRVPVSQNRHARIDHDKASGNTKEVRIPGRRLLYRSKASWEQPVTGTGIGS